jgi:hypothetical protein
VGYRNWNNVVFHEIGIDDKNVTALTPESTYNAQNIRRICGETVTIASRAIVVEKIVDMIQKIDILIMLQ